MIVSSLRQFFLAALVYLIVVIMHGFLLMNCFVNKDFVKRHCIDIDRLSSFALIQFMIIAIRHLAQHLTELHNLVDCWRYYQAFFRWSLQIEALQFNISPRVQPNKAGYWSLKQDIISSYKKNAMLTHK